MRQVLGCMRRACRDFGLIEEGDRIAVGVSGGKDSTLLFHAFKLYQYFSPVEFTYVGIHLDLGFEGTDSTPLQAYAEREGIPLHIVPTDIAHVVFEARKEPNPCSLCAKMRRGVLHETAKSLGCNKIALGHHMDDALETFFMSLFIEGRLNTFSPRVFLSRTDLTQIRPLVYLPEKHIVSTVKKLQLPVMHNPCPANGHTAREDIKQFIVRLEREMPGVKKLMTGALKRTESYNLWDKYRV